MTATRRAILSDLPVLPVASAASQPSDTERLRQLVDAYPDYLARLDGPAIDWRDGTHMPTGLGEPERPFEMMLRDASLADQVRQAYLKGPLDGPPSRDHSPAGFGIGRSS